jgi:hypothetical protein
MKQSAGEGNYEQSTKYANNILEMNPNSYDTLEAKLYFSIKLNRSDDVLDCYDKMILIDGDSFRGTLTRIHKAEYLYDLSRFSEAYEEYNWLRYNGNFGGSGVSPSMKQMYKMRICSGLCNSLVNLGKTTLADCNDECL